VAEDEQRVVRFLAAHLLDEGLQIRDVLIERVDGDAPSGRAAMAAKVEAYTA
jgi:hypothetical protein